MTPREELKPDSTATKVEVPYVLAEAVDPYSLAGVIYEALPDNVLGTDVSVAEAQAQANQYKEQDLKAGAIAQTKSAQAQG